MGQYSWTGNGDGQSWSDPKNWDDVSGGVNPSKSVPGGGDLVIIGSATLNEGGKAAQLVAGGLSLDGADVAAVDVLVNGSLSLADGAAVDATDSTFVAGLSETGDRDLWRGLRQLTSALINLFSRSQADIAAIVWGHSKDFTKNLHSKKLRVCILRNNYYK
jgi:hypothetical protein